VLSLMTDDVVFLMPGQSIMRKGDFAAAMQAQSHQGRLAIEASSDIQETTVQGDWAFMWTRLTVAMTSSNNLERMVRAGHTLTILQKKNGKWLVARDANMLAPVSSYSTKQRMPPVRLQVALGRAARRHCPRDSLIPLQRLPDERINQGAEKR
jgi:uncharacterized protein (TIGR02246 family)